MALFDVYTPVTMVTSSREKELDTKERLYGMT
jgi:hypothetical protein